MNELHEKNIILVVEDDEGLNKLIRKQLQRIGLETHGTTTGKETIEYLESNSDVLLLILDYKLLDYSGNELVELLSEKKLLTPFIIITGHGDERIAVEMMKKGAKDYLVKDVNFLDLLPNVILQVVNELMTQKELLDTQKALKDYEAKYFKLIETSPDAIAVTDESGIIKAANVRESELLGLSEPSLLHGKNIKDFIHPADRSFFNDRINSIFSFDPSDFPLTFEHRIITSEHDISFIEVSVSAVFSSGNAVQEIIFASRDITDRILANEKLKESEEKFRSFVENASDIIITFSKQGYFLYVSPNWKRILGHKPADVIGKHYQHFIHQDDTPIVAEFLKESSGNSDRSKSIEFRILNNNGQYRWHTMTASLIRNEKYEKTLFLGITRDITEKKEYEKNLIEAKELAEQASKLKSSLLANMSHELRTPLNGILGFAQVLKDELEDQPHHTMVEKIVRSAKRLMTTLNSILDLSLIETSEQLIEKEIIDLGNQSALISSEFQDACNDKGLDLQFIPTTEDLPVAVSGRYFKQILSNLLDNAVKFTREGSVTVEAQSNYMDSGKWAVVKVTDTGIGIDEKDRDLIFQEFRQVSEGFSRSFEGTGLGLTIVRKIVEKLHGSIDFESRLGAGTTFTVKFPFAEAVQEKMETETTSVETVEDRKKREKDVLPIVLLAEDNDINRDIVTLYLADICKIESVKDGESAVAAAEKQSFDLILMDINLGKGISGLEAAKQIRKIDGYTDTPIVAITGYALAGDKKKLLEEGMTHYLAKPFQREEITELVSEILNQQSAQT